MCKRKDLSKFNKEPDRDGYTLGQSISKIPAVLCCSQSAVVSVYKKWSQEVTVMIQWHVHRQPRLTDAHGQWRLARVNQSNRQATVAQTAEEANAGSGMTWSDETHFLLLWVLTWPPVSSDLNPSVWDVLDKQAQFMEASQITGLKGPVANILMAGTTAQLQRCSEAHASVVLWQPVWRIYFTKSP